MTDFDDEDGRQVRGAQVQRLVTLSGALVSLALICGMGYWGYMLLVRDVNGVPVVQAMEGAFRVAPEDPGGAEAPYQGLAVNKVAAEGSAGGQVDQVTLAPRPVDLAEEDEPRQALVKRLEAAKAAEAVTAAEKMAEVERADDAPGGEGERLAADEAASVDHQADEALIADAGSGAVEGGSVEPARPGGETGDGNLAGLAVGGDVLTVDDRPDGALATDLAVAEALAGLMAEENEVDVTDATSLRPSPRPDLARTAAALAGDRPVTVSAEVPLPAEIDVASLSTGTSLVQLGAFVDADVARREWSRITEQFGDAFAGKRRVVQPATSGGTTFYRLRAEGFDDLAEARRFCSTLLAGKADCIPVELR